MRVVRSVIVFFLVDNVGPLRDVPPDISEVLGDLGDELSRPRQYCCWKSSIQLSAGARASRPKTARKGVYPVAELTVVL